MWFPLSLAALLCWSGSDLFSKIGCTDPTDKYNHLKMVVAVGAVMGLHAAYEMLFGGVTMSADVFLEYLPVSMLYILSMTIGYLGLRYIELSISSPICNTSGAVVVALYLIMGETIETPQLIAVGLIGVGVLMLGIVQMSEDEGIRLARQEKSNWKYSKSLIALLIPIGYCLLDAAGTFADGIVLETLDENAANVAYELTFLLCGVVSFIYVKLIKKERFLPKAEAPKYVGAVFETAGQFAYIFALGDNAMLAAPVISCYCALSVIWSRVFLKEKLSWKHYVCIAGIIAGIAILGIYDA